MYTHLHTRSAYSLLSSTLRISAIVTNAKQNNCTSVALADKHIMHGAMAFYHACQKEGIKAIFALEVDCIYNNVNYTFLVYAKNDKGYQSLLKLSTFISTNEELLTFDQLLQFDQGVIITTAGDNDELQSFVINEKRIEMQHFLNMCKETIEDFRVAIAMNDSGLLKLKNQLLTEVCNELTIPCFALSRIYYAQEKDEEAFQYLCAIAQQKNVNDPTLDYSSKRYFRSEEQMRALYDEQLIENANQIAQECNVAMAFEKVTLPIFKNKYHVDSNSYLRNLCKKGLEKRRGNQIDDVYVKRLTYELDVIIKMGYADYFLIVYDFIRYAKSVGIYVGPGRGSAAGSLVSYCLGITHVDPIQYNLLFERFLNPERISMPDIDIDFPDNRRDEVINYVKELYGESHVAHIVTFGTLAAKQVLRDVGRAMNISIREIDMICKMIMSAPNVTLKSTFENNGKFKQTIMASKQYSKLFAIALQLEGLPRHASTHAAGIVLASCDISNVCPLIRVEADVCSTQFTMEYLEDLGLIKMDFLGLRNLTIIDEVCQNVERLENKPLDIMKIPLDDKKTFALIQDVDTMGIFQLESEGMKNLIRKMRPKNFEEIAAAIALFRPGPMENIPLYLKNREQPNSINYIHESLKPIIENTYGVMIYQEQIMQAVQIMADFSLGKADILRKAISKKKSAELIALQDEFIQGAINKGYTETLAKQVYELIMKFAGYGFNRSHSIAYALIAYQLAYLKANKPLVFFMSLMNSVIGAENKTSQYVFEAKKRKIKVLHPSVNLSKLKYTIENDALRFPLLNIKSVGSVAAQQIIQEREENGLFKDYFDFVARVGNKKVSRKIIEALIDAGALDEFKEGRLSMKMTLDDAIRYGSLVRIEEESQTRIDLDLVSKPPMILVKENASAIAESEKEVLGFYLSNHPITKLRDSYSQAKSIIELQDVKGYVNFVCFIERIKEHRTKNGDLMAFLSVSDETGKMDAVCMPNIYALKKDSLKRGNYLHIEGKIDKPNSCLVNKLQEIEKT